MPSFVLLNQNTTLKLVIIESSWVLLRCCPLRIILDYCDFMSDKTSHCREGMSYYEPNSTYNNTTMNTSLYDEAVS